MNADIADQLPLGEWLRWVGWILTGAVAVFVVAMWLVLRARMRHQSRTTAGRVVGIVGVMGSGKTYAAVRVAAQRMRDGVDVCSNFTLDPAELGGTGRWAPFTSWEDLEHIRDAVVIIDEAHLLAPSSHAMKFPMQAREALAFARKRGLDLYWISQNADRVNRTLRDLTTEMWQCRRRAFGGFLVERWEPSEFGKQRCRPFLRMRYRFDKGIGQAYDTSQVVQLDDHLAVIDRRERSAAAEARAGRAS